MRPNLLKFWRGSYMDMLSLVCPRAARTSPIQSCTEAERAGAGAVYTCLQTLGTS